MTVSSIFLNGSKISKKSKLIKPGTPLLKLLTLLTAFLCCSQTEISAQTQIPVNKRKKILIVVSSQDKKGEPNITAGFWFPELTHPLEVYDKEGYDIDIASPKGGLPPFDGFNLTDPVNSWFWTNPKYRNKLGTTIKFSDVNPSNYIAIQMVGGHGPMFDFTDNKELHYITRKIYENNGIVSAVCHGPAGLINLKLSNGKLLIDGKRITAFSAAEEQNRDFTRFVPFELEKKLKENGAVFEKAAEIFGVKVCTDSRIVTGQNPASAHEFGEAVVAAIKSLQQN
ncbi:type 1 glutamine amidotransferase domain-containing protein [Flavobacterium limi]|uniref:Dihydroxyacetone kinase n=1 Tax=Flavobacterium limi TaxID=2045105 RepID=A0ABQ1UX34_9FLAO|nr:type 1 glutamine amidotransferase domain-containing protein [Flavobacterium limi]GGF29062.1 dihydroxyacetone kinase [Flavobacterium limi]